MFFTDHVTVYTFWSWPKYYVFCSRLSISRKHFAVPNNWLCGDYPSTKHCNSYENKKYEIQCLVPLFHKENTIVFKQNKQDGETKLQNEEFTFEQNSAQVARLVVHGAVTRVLK